jgi:uncharacterized protein (DUF488 family)
MATIFTIGHSTRTLAEFVAVLQVHGIRTLVDIRSYPTSRRLPWFQGPQHPAFMTTEQAEQHEALETTLPREGIAYRWMRQLGGRRPKIRDNSPHTALRSTSFRNYADYMLTPEFHAGIAGLVGLAENSPTCIMCAEAQVYWHCHRMLVSDFLTAQGHNVLHLEGTGPAKPHRLTAEARIVGGNVLYDGGMLAF